LLCRIAGFQPALLWPGAMPPPHHVQSKAAQRAALREAADAAARHIDAEVLRFYNTRILWSMVFTCNLLKINT